MKKIIVTLTLFGLTLGCVAQEESRRTLPYTFPFKSDPRESGWTYIPPRAKKGEKAMEFVPSEGSYLTKGGGWKSPKIKCTDDPWQFYKMTFKSKSTTKSYYAVFFYDQNDKGVVADDYASFYKSEDFVENEVIFRGREEGTSFEVVFRSTGTFEVQDVHVKPITDEEAVAWHDQQYAKLPPLAYTAPKGRHALLPKTMAKLKAGGPLRVLMLGDSIINDTNNSNWDALVGKHFPKADIRVMCSVRGSTGCWHYEKPEAFKSYVTDRKPDFVIIGGISQKGKLDPIANVIDMIRKQIGCEMLLCTGPVGPDWRKKDKDHLDAPLPKADHTTTKFHEKQWAFYSKMEKLAQEKKVAFFDLYNPWHNYMGNSQKPWQWFHRDRVHAEDRGKQILARLMERWFAPE